jgi:hypothetical protein
MVNSPQSEPHTITLHVSVLECRGLSRGGWPLTGPVSVRVGVTEPAAAPPAQILGPLEPFGSSRWARAPQPVGQTALFQPQGCPTGAQLEVFDSKAGQEAGLIGACTVPLLELLSADQPWSTCAWFSLQDRRGKPAGEVWLFLRWAPEADPLGGWHLHAAPLECAGLSLGFDSAAADVFVSLHVEGRGAEAKSSVLSRRSAAVVDSSPSPKWGGSTSLTRISAAPPGPPMAGDASLFDRPFVLSQPPPVLVAEVWARRCARCMYHWSMRSPS